MASCIIANLANAEWDQKLPPYQRPTFWHGTRDSAEAKCLRLAKLIPEGQFVIFEAAAMAIPTRSDPEVYLIEPCNL